MEYEARIIGSGELLMKTQIFDFTKSPSPLANLGSLVEISRLLTTGEVVAFPTETVYGLGANAFNAEAVNKIFVAKGRPADNPLIVHIADSKMLNLVVKTVPKKAKTLMDAFWPGPLTIIMEKAEAIPMAVTAGLETVGVRMPSNQIARMVIESAGVPIAAPSANLSGKPSPTKGEHVLQDMNGRVAGIIVGDDSSVGVESTVIDLTQAVPVILRPGAITSEDIRQIIGEIKISESILKNVYVEHAAAPGMKYRHYAPKGELYIVRGTDQERQEKIAKQIKKHQNKRIGLLVTDETRDLYQADIKLSLGSKNKVEELNHNIFACLREFDTLEVDIIYAEALTLNSSTMAVINRMYKAGGYRFI